MKSTNSKWSRKLVSRTVLFITLSLLSSGKLSITYAATVPAGFTDSLVALGSTILPRWRLHPMVASLSANKAGLFVSSRMAFCSPLLS